ncbi:type II toxin-antitoxin system VapC family toxin [soil metagenome]
MKFLLDTNVCIDVLKGNALVTAHFQAHLPRDFVLSSITEFELRQVAERAPSAYQIKERRKVDLFLSRFRILPFDTQHAQTAAIINAELLNKGTSISLPDMFIAATALSLDLPLVTNNQKEFKRIKRLQIMDWRKP